MFVCGDDVGLCAAEHVLAARGARGSPQLRPRDSLQLQRPGAPPPCEHHGDPPDGVQLPGGPVRGPSPLPALQPGTGSTNKKFYTKYLNFQ